MKLIFVIFLLNLSLNVLSQSNVHYTFYDKDSILFKYERKYQIGDTTIYYRNHGSKTVGVLYVNKNAGDSTILLEKYFYINGPQTKLEKLQECDMWSETSNSNKDTVTLIGSKMMYKDSNIEYVEVADTTLYGQDAKESWNFHNKIKHAQLPLIINNTNKLNLDFAEFNESSTSIFKNGLLIKTTRINQEGKISSYTSSKIVGNSISYKSYFHENDIHEFYRTDSFVFLKDFSKMIYFSNRFDNISYSNKTLYNIKNNLLDISYSDSLKTTIKFEDKNPKKIVEYIINGNMLYDDVPFVFYSRQLDKGLKIDIIEKDYTEKNYYLQDNKQKIEKVRQYINGKLNYTVLINED